MFIYKFKDDECKSGDFECPTDVNLFNVETFKQIKAVEDDFMSQPEWKDFCKLKQDESGECDTSSDWTGGYFGPINTFIGDDDINAMT